MAKFKIGDKVIAKNGAPYGFTTNGWTGEVVGTLENPNGYEIWSGDIKVRNEDGTFCVRSKYFDLVNEPQKIVITTDGVKTTTARLYEGKRVIKTAIAKCSPDDKFNFSTGAKIVTDRLFANCEPKFTKADLKNGMFVIMSDGKIGVVVNDTIVYDTGGFDRFDQMSDDMCFMFKRVVGVVTGVSFNDAEVSFENNTEDVIYRRK